MSRSSQLSTLGPHGVDFAIELLERLPIGIALLGPDRTVLYENPALEQIVGISKTEFASGKHQARRYLRADGTPMPEAEFASVRAAHEGHAVYNVETGVVTETGALVWTQVSATPLSLASGVGVLVTTIDITARKQAEAERERLLAVLRDSEQRFRIAAETANDVVYDWDLGDVVQWPGQVDALLGYQLGEFPRTFDAWVQALHPDDRDATLAAVRAHLEEQRPYAVEYRIRRKDGRYSWWAARGAMARDATGAPRCWVGSVTDITARKQAESEREHLIAQLTCALEQIKTLKGIVPICASCKKIRDDQGYWQQVESYVTAHTEATFSHGICPECEQKLYAGRL